MKTMLIVFIKESFFVLSFAKNKNGNQLTWISICLCLASKFRFWLFCLVLLLDYGFVAFIFAFFNRLISCKWTLFKFAPFLILSKKSIQKDLSEDLFSVGAKTKQYFLKKKQPNNQLNLEITWKFPQKITLTIPFHSSTNFYYKSINSKIKKDILWNN